jgi:hypothetical protein
MDVNSKNGGARRPLAPLGCDVEWSDCPTTRRGSRLQKVRRGASTIGTFHPFPHQEDHMGKYVLAWLLGVPAFVLVIVYMLAH